MYDNIVHSPPNICMYLAADAEREIVIDFTRTPTHTGE